MYKALLLFSAFLLSFAHIAIAQCTVVITSTGTQLCSGSSMILSASPGADIYQWYENGTPIGTNTDNISISPTTTSSYTVAATFGTCNITSVPYTVNVIIPPTITVTSNSPACGGTLMLSVMPTGGTYQWVGPNGFTSTMQNPTIPNAFPFTGGTYCVSVTINGCTVTDCITVSIPSPTQVVATNDGPVCFGGVLQFSATTGIGATYSWTGPGGFTSTLQNPTINVDNTTDPGIYTVTLTESACSSTDTTMVTICNTLFVNIYNDVNNNCIYEANTDLDPYLPIEIEVDSNSVPIDTLSVTSGFYYTVNGSSGDVYDFKIIDLTGGVVPTCPLTGIVTHLLQPNSFNTIEMGISCDPNSSDFDLFIYPSDPTSTATFQSGHISVFNSYCTPTNATVTLQHSDAYTHFDSSPSPTSISGNIITWDLTNVSLNVFNPFVIWYQLSALTPLIAGDTTHSLFTLSPTTGDVDPSNNTSFIIDTVVASWDPNAITAFPRECVAAGTKMQYMIEFENLGNAPAQNIYVLDTLPADLEMNTMKLLMNSHNMYVTKIQNGGYNILRFDFPNINLPDSSDHAGRHGQLVYTIDLNSNLPFGAEVYHKAGIYFDYNAVVMTNNERTTICIPQSVTTTTKDGSTILYPNPAGDVLTLQTDGTYSNCTISNSIGQTVAQQQINGKQTTIDVHAFAPGIYYININGAQNNEVLKFVKK
jgi:uncharacterized repeat protein (TIGR01451 family)